MPEIKVTISPENATNKNFTVTSSDENVVSIGADNSPTVVGAGSATLTITTEDGGFTADVDVVVEVPVVKLTGVGADPDAVTVNLGDELTISL